jgi:multimeric flavodoxin WrbA
MNILAFNSSPRDNETRKTELVLQIFLEGARRAGAAAETLYLRNYQIKHCLGCFDCWLKSPGRCVQKDDMTDILFDRYLQADLVVLASPVYHATMNARMKLLVERTLPMMDPLKEAPEGGAPHRFEKMPKVVTLSVCGFWEQSMFDAMSLTWRMCLAGDLIAEIYRHSAEFLSVPEFQTQAQPIFDALAQAGEEVVRQGKVTTDTMNTLTQPLAPPRNPGPPGQGGLVPGRRGIKDFGRGG